jgi:predicted nuclease with TOPRIM domain
MSTVKEIESALARLSVQDLQAVRDWLDDFIEDQLEVSEEFKEKIQRAQTEIARGVHSRVRTPRPGQ